MLNVRKQVKYDDLSVKQNLKFFRGADLHAALEEAELRHYARWTELKEDYKEKCLKHVLIKPIL